MPEISTHARATANGLQLHLMSAHDLPEATAMSLDLKGAARHHQPPHDHMIPTRRWQAAIKTFEAERDASFRAALENLVGGGT